MFITRAIFSDEFYQFVNSTLTQSFIILQLRVVDLTHPPRDKLCALWKENRKDRALAEWKDFLKYLEYYAQPLAMTFQSWIL